jgi:hypothetical protein
MSSRLTKGWKRIKEKWVLGRWTRQMISLRKRERECPLGGVARKAKGKDLG